METSVGLACALVMSAWILYAGQPCENWMAPYTGADATGEKVVGLWAFADLKDASGKGRDAVLHGAVLVPDDRWAPVWNRSAAGRWKTNATRPS
jgi:hypothetical protein